jgi:hypothetical protein
LNRYRNESDKTAIDITYPALIFFLRFLSFSRSRLRAAASAFEYRFSLVLFIASTFFSSFSRSSGSSMARSLTRVLSIKPCGLSSVTRWLQWLDATCCWEALIALTLLLCGGGYNMSATGSDDIAHDCTMVLHAREMGHKQL